MSAHPGAVALVTGSSSGIGNAIARALATLGLTVCLTGRDECRMREVAREIESTSARTLVFKADLSDADEVRGLADALTREVSRLDILVHAAGLIRLGDVESGGWDDLDEQYRVNLRAPFLLTKALIPLLKASAGDVVVINSTAALATRAEHATYGATKHGLRSLADGLRDKLNRDGVRVLSVYPGRVATPMQERVHEFEGRPYEPASLMQASDVAEVVVASLRLPRRAEVTDIVVRSSTKVPPANAPTRSPRA
jgi:NADP-dependent 3-hydroxy acid dehydrogenase YdfG